MHDQVTRVLVQQRGHLHGQPGAPAHATRSPAEVPSARVKRAVSETAEQALVLGPGSGSPAPSSSWVGSGHHLSRTLCLLVGNAPV